MQLLEPVDHRAGVLPLVGVVCMCICVCMCMYVCRANGFVNADLQNTQLSGNKESMHHCTISDTSETLDGQWCLSGPYLSRDQDDRERMDQIWVPVLPQQIAALSDTGNFRQNVRNI